MDTTKKRVQKEYVKETVNGTTGEVEVTEHITQSVLPREPDFVKLYLKDIMYLRDLPTSLNAVMYQLLTTMDYENLITLNAGRKRRIAERTKLSISTVNNAISSFVKGKLLTRIDTGIYQANPYLFGKGDWTRINGIRMEIAYSLGGKTIKTIIDNGEEVQSDSEGR